MKYHEPLYIAKPSLPPLAALTTLLESVWEKHCVSNYGPLEQQLTATLQQKLHAQYLTLTGNGTLALLTGLRALELSGEVITTPYTFAATVHSIVWSNCVPVFCDVNPTTGNIDPDKIEALITAKTSAILAVHIYGTPCEYRKLAAIAENHRLKLVFDAAHAFDVQENQEYIVNQGDLTILSFHATKKFHTCEGGAILCSDSALHDKVLRMCNFGIKNAEEIPETGINAKMDEIRAAVGLLQLENLAAENLRRDQIIRFYRENLTSVAGIRMLPEMPNVNNNNSYFPIFVEPSEHGISRNELFERLAAEKIICRKYFYPLLSNTLPYAQYPSADRKLLPVANLLADTVLCLPLNMFLSAEQLERIVNMIRKHV